MCECCFGSIQAHAKSVNSVKFLHGKAPQLLVTGSDDATVAVWTVWQSDASVKMRYFIITLHYIEVIYSGLSN